MASDNMVACVQVNNVPLKAFVDSGAQSCVMSLACAERCNIAHLIDRRFQGIVQGVGTQQIAGRVHSVRPWTHSPSGSLTHHCQTSWLGFKSLDTCHQLPHHAWPASTSGLPSSVTATVTVAECTWLGKDIADPLNVEHKQWNAMTQQRGIVNASICKNK